MKKFLLLLAVASVWFTTGCNTHDDGGNYQNLVNSLNSLNSSANQASSVRLALQPILQNVSSLFGSGSDSL